MKLLKPVLILLIVALLGYAIVQSGLYDLLKDQDALEEFIASKGVFGYVVFVLLFIVASIINLATPFTIVAGIVFGPYLGSLLALIGATLGAVVCFLMSRYLFRNAIVNKFGDSSVFKKIDEGVEKNGKDFLILTRLVPAFPYTLQNYAYGVTNINLATYTIVSAITMAPGAFIFAYLAGDIKQNGVSVMLLLKFAAAGIILFGVAQIPKIIAKRKGIEIEK